MIFYYYLFHRNAVIGKLFRLGVNCNVTLWGNFNFSIDSGVYLRNFCRIQVEGGRLKIGKNTFFNNFCSINCLHKIIIGDNCLFGEGVKLYDHNHNYSGAEPINRQGYSLGEIIIGNNCWIGSNVVILKNVHIGNNVVIGANCVIHKNIESDSIVTCNAAICRQMRGTCDKIDDGKMHVYEG